MKMATLKQARKVLDLVEGTPCSEMQELLESGLFSDLLTANIDDINRNEFRKLCGLNPLIWKTIKIGNYAFRTGRDFEQALLQRGFSVDPSASYVLGKIELTGKERLIKLVKVTGKSLGFERSASRRDIYAKARTFGLVPCPAETGLHVALQCQDRLDKESMLIAMERPYHDREDKPVIFCLGERTGPGHWFSTDCGGIDDCHDPVTQWVFVQSH